MHLVILLLPNLEEEIKVIFCEMVGKMRCLFFLSLLVVAHCNGFLVYTCQLPTWRDLLLHLETPVTIVGLSQIDYWGG
jgi:hypothetical protein